MPFIEEGKKQPHDLTNYVPTAEQLEKQQAYSRESDQSEMAWLAIFGMIAVGLLWFIFIRRKRIVRAASESTLTAAAYGLRVSKKVNSGVAELKKAVQDKERNL